MKTDLPHGCPLSIALLSRASITIVWSKSTWNPEAASRDRKWALHLDASPNRFTPTTPNYLHKSAFLCAFTANVLLASFATQFDDAARILTVSRRRGAGAAAGPLLQESLESGEGRERIAAFFSNASGRAVTVVGGEGESQGRQRHHQFGNTESGIRVGDGSTRTIHVVNAKSPTRWLTYLPSPACRYTWIGSGPTSSSKGGCLPGTSSSGSGAPSSWVRPRSESSSGRCGVMASINVDARHASGEADVDVPALLARHFPEHGPYLGVYAQVVTGGAVRIGDRVLASS